MLTRSLMLLGTFGYSALAGKARSLKQVSGVSPRQVTECPFVGWIPVCPGDLECIPSEGTCCTGGYYHLPGETCPPGESEVPRIDQSNPPSATITPAPAPTSIPDPTVIDYTWYTYAYTYYYYYYYYYYFDATYEITSTETTYYTTFSFTASDQAAANSIYESVTAAIVDAATTLQSETPTLGSVPASTATPTPTLEPASTSVVTPSSTRVVISSARSSTRASTSSEDATPTVESTSASASTPSQFTGAATSFRVGSTAVSANVFALTFGAFILTPGMLMLLL